MSALERRLTAIEKKIAPPYRFCVWTENADGSEERFEKNTCAFGHAEPSVDDCNDCPAHKIIIVFVPPMEEDELSAEREKAGGPRSFTP